MFIYIHSTCINYVMSHGKLINILVLLRLVIECNVAYTERIDSESSDVVMRLNNNTVVINSYFNIH